MSKLYLQKQRRGKRRGARPRPTPLLPPKIRLTAVDVVPKKRLVRGTVVRARISFRDGTGDKVRPAVVEEFRGGELIVRPATSSKRRHGLPHGYVELHDLGQAGLVVPTGASTLPVTIERIDVLGVLGRLSYADDARLFGPKREAADEVHFDAA